MFVRVHICCIMDIVLVTSMSTSTNSVFIRFTDLEPRIHNSMDLNNENDIFVRMNVVAIDFDILSFSAIISVNLEYNFLHSRPIPPFTENTNHGGIFIPPCTNGVKVPFSTFNTLALYFFFFSSSFFKKTFL